MQEEDVKQKLKTFREAKRKYEAVRIQLEECETMITSVNFDYSKERVQTSPEMDKLADVIDRLSYLRNRCIEQADEAVRCMEEVKMLIDCVDGRMRDLLTRRYIKGETWERIAVETNRSWNSTHRLHRQALKKIAETVKLV